MEFKRKMITVSENVVNIVNDALVLQHDFCDGKPIPAIVIDTSNNNKIENMLKLHMNVDEGEMKFSWGIQNCQCVSRFLQRHMSYIIFIAMQRILIPALLHQVLYWIQKRLMK